MARLTCLQSAAHPTIAHRKFNLNTGWKHGKSVRRVVTGHDKNGTAVVTMDGDRRDQDPFRRGGFRRACGSPTKRPPTFPATRTAHSARSASRRR